jgi:phage terminase small subunit
VTTKKDDLAHLSPAAREWYLGVTKDYTLDSHHTLLLQLAAEAWDRVQQAREILAAEGLVVHSKSGSKQHPVCAVERDARIAFARLIAQLGLDEAGIATPNGNATWKGLEHGKAK